MIKISVGIPAHNEQQNIKTLIESVLNQTGGNFEILEIIIISDGSTDKTVAEIKSIHNPRIKLLDYPERLGQALRQNEILESFQGDVLILLNADILIRDVDFFSKLIQSMVTDEQIGIVCPKVVPLVAQNFFEKVINFSVSLKDEIYTQINHTDTVYLCHGRARAMSKRFAQVLRFPGTVGEDAFSYISCKTSGFKFFYEQNAVIYYRSPQNLSDHLKQSKRFFKGRKKLSQLFPSIDQYYKIPKILVVKKIFKYFFKNPIVFICYFLILIYARFLSFFHRPQPIWDEALSSKKLIG